MYVCVVMKTLSGKIVTSKPTSLSKASRVLSNFVSADTGASQLVSGYLRRTTAAFDELVQLHKELKRSRNQTRGDEDGVGEKKRKMREIEERESGGSESMKKKKKKKRKIESEE